MGNSAPASETPLKKHAWNIASRRGINRAEFEARYEQAATDPDKRNGFWLFVVGTGPHEDRIYDPDVEGDIPEHLLGQGAAGCLLDENMSVEGCRWPTEVVVRGGQATHPPRQDAIIHTPPTPTRRQVNRYVMVLRLRRRTVTGTSC